MAKVLHIVESLDRGAVENWLVRMLAHGRSVGAPIDWTFYCVEPCNGALANRAKALGASVIVAPVRLARHAAFAGALRGEVRRGGYDVLHCHHDLVSGLYLAATAGLTLRRRIVHIHNADEGVPSPSRIKQRLYRPLLRQACLALADRIVGISNHTLTTFLAGRVRRPGRDTVHYYGVDPAPFVRPPPDRIEMRREFGFDETALILLFGGRLVPEKNPLFAVDVLAEVRKREPRAVALFVGTGSLEQAVADRARAFGVADAVRLAGWRDDLSQLMRAADWFILPRPEQPTEGFGLAVVEAQLAGLHLLLSRGIPDDPLLSTASVRRLPLAASPATWAAAAAEMIALPAPSPAAAAAALAASPMNMDRALDGLLALYE